MEAIRTTALCKAYGTKNAVDNLDLSVQKGAVYRFIEKIEQESRQRKK